MLNCKSSLINTRCWLKNYRYKSLQHQVLPISGLLSSFARSLSSLFEFSITAVLRELLDWLESGGAVGHSVGSRQAKAARLLTSATADSALPVNSPSLAILSALEHHDDSRQRAVLRPPQSSTAVASSSTIALPANWVPAPPPKVKRFMLNDARDRYLPLVKEYSADPKSGNAPPMLDLNSPPFTCPFGSYAPEDYEIEKERYERRRRKRQEERKSRDAAKKAAAEAAAQGRPPPLPTASIMAEVSFVISILVVYCA
jgi:hypothetical protein